MVGLLCKDGLDEVYPAPDTGIARKITIKCQSISLAIKNYEQKLFE